MAVADEYSSYNGGDDDDSSERSNISMKLSTVGHNIDDNEIIARQESTRVNASKSFIYLFLCVAAAGAGWGTHIYMKKEEQVWFHDEFDEFASDIIKMSLLLLAQADAAVLSLSDEITSYYSVHGQNENATVWPYVNVPNFDIRASSIKKIVRADVIAFAPLVKDGIKDADNTTVRASVAVNDRLPIWQLAPAPVDPTESPLFLDLFSLPEFEHIMEEVVEHRRSVLSPALKDHRALTSYKKMKDPREERASKHEDEESEEDEEHTDDIHVPKSVIVGPVFETFAPDSNLVGVVVAVIPWDDFFDIIVKTEADGIVIDLMNTCDGSVDTVQITESGTKWAAFDNEIDAYHIFTKRVRFSLSTAEDEDDTRDEDRYDDNKHDHIRRRLASVEPINETDRCGFDVVVHMSEDFTDNWADKRALLYPIVISSIFVFIGLIFAIYDFTVQKMQQKVITTATQNERLVSTIFPKAVRERLIEEDEAKQAAKPKKGMGISQQFADFAGADGKEDVALSSKPIAQLFPNATIMFADIVGFTSWSSTREPNEVFTLLETLYGAFDKIASRRGVFKVETIGDCYLAVCGLPDPNPDHAQVMAQFAWECCHTMKRLVGELESRLGPDTEDLSMRAGLHSGPVTAGVLRGVRARFQLFGTYAAALLRNTHYGPVPGDTVNTAARMESTGKPTKIQVSSETANLLTAAGKDHWIKKREESVTAKGKGVMETYWLDLTSQKKSSTTSSVHSASHAASDLNNSQNKMEPHNAWERAIRHSKEERLIDWCVEVLSPMLCDIVQSQRSTRDNEAEQMISLLEESTTNGKIIPLDETMVSICFTQLTGPKSHAIVEPTPVSIPSAVLAQLRQFVSDVAVLYRNDNTFHGFGHACHVIQSTVRFLERSACVDSATSDVTFDPLTKFALVLAALLHDADHSGVSNAQLVKEQTPEAVRYRNKCVAEQTSLDHGWKLLMKNEFADLRRTIYACPEEFRHFRQAIVNCIIATDIFDPEQVEERSRKFNAVFISDDNDDGDNAKSPSEKAAMKMTTMLEHMIQASDVSHTMQHWFVYRRWNELLYLEMHKAYQCGRMGKDPAEFWYEGELSFFDNYIIPLAGKLVKFGCLIQSNDELLSYARQNRDEWAERGHDIVASMKERASAQCSIVNTSNETGNGTNDPPRRSDVASLNERGPRFEI